MMFEDLCDELTEELKECIEHIKNLEFYVKPDYELLRRNAMRQSTLSNYQQDWSDNEELLMFGNKCNENKEKVGIRHHRKLKTRLIKEKNRR